MICPSCGKPKLGWIRDMTAVCENCGKQFVHGENGWWEE